MEYITRNYLLIFSCLFYTGVRAQSGKVATDQKHADQWSISNRKATFKDNVLMMNGMPDQGLAILKHSNFAKGTIEVDIKGRDVQGESFVGFAFHGLNDSTFDGVYFRAFNFKNPERKNHSVQYISHPTYTWKKLRDEYPGKYENEVNPVPDPENWFHVTLVIDYPSIKVFVNHSDHASLEVTQLSERSKGFIGLWVGNDSEGAFRNLEIKPAQ